MGKDISGHVAVLFKKALTAARLYDQYDEDGYYINPYNGQDLLVECLDFLDAHADSLNLNWIYEKMGPDRDETWKDRMQRCVSTSAHSNNFPGLYRVLRAMQLKNWNEIDPDEVIRSKSKKTVDFGNPDVYNTVPNTLTFYSKPRWSKVYPAQKVNNNPQNSIVEKFRK